MHWRRILIVVWLSQFLAIAGFSFSVPFGPYFIQELGVAEGRSLHLWVTLFTAATPLSLALVSPLWGAFADRYGRRIMLLRAYIGGTVVLALMGLVHSVETLVVLRLLQGVFTGSVTAAQTLVTVHAPHERSGLALGALSAAVFSGSLFGNFLGGIFAYYFGYRSAFLASSVFLVAAGLLVFFGTTETFVPPDEEEEGNGREHGFHLRWPELGAAWPILGMIAAIGLIRQFDGGWTPLLVQEIHGGLKGAALWSGALHAVCAVAGLVSGFTLGRLADRLAPPRIGQWSAFAAALLMIPSALAQGFFTLFWARAGVTFCAGGLDPVFQVWLAKITPESRRGFVFGWAATARAIGWIAAPLLSGAVAAVFGLRAVFVAGACLYLLFVVLVALVVRKTRRADEGEPPLQRDETGSPA